MVSASLTLAPIALVALLTAWTLLVASYVRVFCFLTLISCLASTVADCLLPVLAAFLISASSFFSSLSSSRLSLSTSLVTFLRALSFSFICSLTVGFFLNMSICSCLVHFERKLSALDFSANDSDLERS